jgi:glyoxylase-like metal-dependent hydrolase (beta-lactamase superfamily II)
MFDSPGVRVMVRGCRIAALSGLAFAPVLVAQAPDVSKLEYRSEKLAENLHVLFGGGGNVAVLTGTDGTVLVDADIVELTPKLRAALAGISDRPVRFLIDTHFHFDHTGGNAPLGRTGTVIVGHDNVRKHLMTRQTLKVDVGIEVVTEPTPREGLPVVTFKEGLRLHLNDDVIEVAHVDNAHTDSDALVFFEHANVLHTGDLFMTTGYPIIDAGNGGSLNGLIDGLARALKYCDAKTRVIPGHGVISGTADLRAYRDMLIAIRQRVAEMVRAHRSVEQVLAANPTRDFDERWGKGFITPKLFTQRVFIEQKLEAQKTE